MFCSRLSRFVLRDDSKMTTTTHDKQRQQTPLSVGFTTKKKILQEYSKTLFV
jgi:hypothetical protein